MTRMYNVVVPVVANIPASSPAEAVASLTAALRGHGFEPYVPDEETTGLAPFLASDDTEATALAPACTDPERHWRAR